MKKLTCEYECESCGESITMSLDIKTGLLSEDNPNECPKCGHEFSEDELVDVQDQLLDVACTLGQEDED